MLKLQYFGRLIWRADSWKRPWCRGQSLSLCGISREETGNCVFEEGPGNVRGMNEWMEHDEVTGVSGRDWTGEVVGLFIKRKGQKVPCVTLGGKLKWSEVAQSCLTPRDPMDCSLPGFSIHGIFQARVLEWGAISFSWGNKEASLWWGKGSPRQQPNCPGKGVSLEFLCVLGHPGAAVRKAGWEVDLGVGFERKGS